MDSWGEEVGVSRLKSAGDASSPTPPPDFKASLPHNPRELHDWPVSGAPFGRFDFGNLADGPANAVPESEACWGHEITKAVAVALGWDVLSSR